MSNELKNECQTKSNTTNNNRTHDEGPSGEKNSKKRKIGEKCVIYILQNTYI